MELSTLIALALAAIATVPGILTFIGQLKKTGSDATSNLIDNLQEERKELRQEVKDLKDERSVLLDGMWDLRMEKYELTDQVRRLEKKLSDTGGTRVEKE